MSYGFLKKVKSPVKRALLLSIALGVIVGCILYFTSDAIVFRSVSIALTYAITSWSLSIFPYFQFILPKTGSVPKLKKSAISILFLLISILIATILAELILFLVFYKEAFQLLGPYNMFWLNLMFTVFVIWTASSKEGKSEALSESIKPDSLVFKSGRKLKRLEFQQMLYFQAKDKLVFIYTKDGKKHLIDQPLSKITSQLPEFFIKISRSCILNKKEILEISKNKKGDFLIKLVGTETTPLKSGSTYKKALKSIFSLYRV